MPGKSLENMHVAVLAGGHSAEREISLNSGKNVVVALKEAGYTSVELLDTAADDFMVTMATGGFDVAFIAMHGAGGEDGAMQGAWRPWVSPTRPRACLPAPAVPTRRSLSSCTPRRAFPLPPASRSRWAMKSISIISSRFVASAAL